jgi:ornithine cyclodeaminase/alanine dehydrogenase-like protein (mu-crystallin family)
VLDGIAPTNRRTAAVSAPAALRAEELVSLADGVRHGIAPSGPRLLKSTGRAWEDAVVAAAVVRSALGA